MAFLKISFVAVALIATVVADVSHLKGVRNTYLPPSAATTAPGYGYAPPATTAAPEPAQPFEINYAVNEDGNMFAHNAASDGDAIKGEYRVLLPDGRTQIVKYTADSVNGYNADVIYEGTAKFPEDTPAQPPKNQYVPPKKVNNQYLPPQQLQGPY